MAFITFSHGPVYEGPIESPPTPFMEQLINYIAIISYPFVWFISFIKGQSRIKSNIKLINFIPCLWFVYMGYSFYREELLYFNSGIYENILFILYPSCMVFLLQIDSIKS